MTARIGVVSFPGSVDARATTLALRLAGAEPVALWHADRGLDEVDAVVLPGGCSYGDHLRSGALARHSPVMIDLIAAARHGLPVLGIGNGFQVLCETALLPGGLVRNEGGTFVCREQRLRVETRDTVWTCAAEDGQEVTLVLKSRDGRYVADADTLRALEESRQVVLRYLGPNPNGSLGEIAGVTNERGNVVGLMPHPEYAVDTLTGPSTDGRRFLVSALEFLAARV